MKMRRFLVVAIVTMAILWAIPAAAIQYGKISTSATIDAGAGLDATTVSAGSVAADTASVTTATIGTMTGTPDFNEGLESTTGAFTGALSIGSESEISEDGSDLTFEDGTTGPFTLSELVGGAGGGGDSVWTEDGPKIYWEDTSVWNNGDINTSGDVTAEGEGSFSAGLESTTGTFTDRLSIGPEFDGRETLNLRPRDTIGSGNFIAIYKTDTGGNRWDLGLPPGSGYFRFRYVGSEILQLRNTGEFLLSGTSKHIGTNSDSDLMQLADDLLTISGDLSLDGDITLTTGAAVTMPDGGVRTVGTAALVYNDAFNVDYSISSGTITCYADIDPTIMFDFPADIKIHGASVVLDSVLLHYQGEDGDTLGRARLLKRTPGSNESAVGDQSSISCNGSWQTAELLSGDYTMQDDYFYWLQIDFNNTTTGKSVMGFDIQYHYE